jgi:hypothetical protein
MSGQVEFIVIFALVVVCIIIALVILNMASVE